MPSAWEQDSDSISKVLLGDEAFAKMSRLIRFQSIKVSTPKIYLSEKYVRWQHTSEIRVSYIQEGMWEIDEGKGRSVQSLKNLVTSFQTLEWTMLAADTSGILAKGKKVNRNTNSKVCLFFLVSIAIYPWKSLSVRYVSYIQPKSLQLSVKRYKPIFFLVAPCGKKFVLPQETRNMPSDQGYIYSFLRKH